VKKYKNSGKTYDKSEKNKITPADNTYQQFSKDVCNLLENARKSAGRAVMLF